MMNVGNFFKGWRSEVWIVLAVAFVSVILWRMPMFEIVFYPFRLFNTFVHELSHGLAAIATGGQFLRFSVSPDLSGLAWSAGGIRFIVASAGYLGSTLFGGLLLVMVGWGIPARSLLLLLGMVLAALCLLFVRNLFGIFAGLLLSLALVVAGWYLSEFWADALLLLLAVQAILAALDSVYDLILISSALHGVHTDAQTVSELTGIPSILWALLWSFASILILIGALTLAYRRSSAPLFTR